MRCHRKHTLGVGDSCRVYTPWLVKIGINPYYCSLGISHNDTLCWGHLMSPDHIVNDLDHHLPWTFQERRFWIIVLFDDTHCPPRVCYASTRAVSDFTLVVTSICCCFHFSFGLGCPQYAPPKLSPELVHDRWKQCSFHEQVLLPFYFFLSHTQWCANVHSWIKSCAPLHYLLNLTPNYHYL